MLKIRNIQLNSINKNIQNFSRQFSQAKLEKSLAECKDIVRKNDYDSYLISTFLDPRTRPHYYSIKALCIELASIRDQVTQPQLALVRLQWWKERLDGLKKDQVSEHPILMLLHHTLKTYKSNLTTSFFNRIISQRIEHTQNPHFSTLDDLENYTENTVSSELYLQLEILKIRDSVIEGLLSHLGKAKGIVTLLRGLPHLHSVTKESVIPDQLLAQYNISQEQLFRSSEVSDPLRDAIFEIATKANDQLLTVNYLLDQLSVEQKLNFEKAFPLFLSSVPLVNYLNQLEKVNFDPYHQSLHTRDWKLVGKLAYYNYTKNLPLPKVTKE